MATGLSGWTPPPHQLPWQHSHGNWDIHYYALTIVQDTPEKGMVPVMTLYIKRSLGCFLLLANGTEVSRRGFNISISIKRH